MRYKFKFQGAVESMNLGCGTDSVMGIIIGKTDEEKINQWLSEILNENKNIDTMHFPVLTYEVDTSGGIGPIMIVKEHISGKKLDLTNIDLW